MNSESETDEPPTSKKPRIEKKPLTKSKLGCRACKARKVKCDERHPLCSNCAKRYPGLDECEWNVIVYHKASQKPEPLSILLHTSQQTNGSESSQRSSSFPASVPTPTFQGFAHPLNSRLLELRLFHQWTSCTVHTIKDWVGQSPVLDWLDQTPNWALEHDFILEFILSSAALHLYCIDPVGNASFKPSVHHYTANASQLHRQALANVNAGNARQLFLAAMWTSMFGKTRPMLREPNESYRLPLDMFYLHRGLVVTYNAVKPFVSAREMEAIRSVSSEELIYEQGANLEELSYLSEKQRKDIDELLVHIAERSAVDEEAASILKHTLSFIVSIQFGFRVHEPERWTRRRISMMQAIVPPAYVTLLEAEDPLAMAILARFFICLHGRKEWFHSGLARIEVKGIASLMPEQMMFLIEYPLSIVDASDE